MYMLLSWEQMHLEGIIRENKNSHDIRRARHAGDYLRCGGLFFSLIHYIRFLSSDGIKHHVLIRILCIHMILFHMQIILQFIRIYEVFRILILPCL